MSICLVQGGSSLYTVNLSTGTATTLTLPTGVTLSTTRKPKFATLNQWTVMVNSPSENIVIDPEGTMYPLVPRPPLNGPSMAAGGGTGLTGAYLYKTSYIITNSDGELLLESPLSPASVSTTLTNQNASLTDIAVSLDTISARRIYRTLSGGTAYYQLLDVDGNTATAFIENVADATVTLLPVVPSSLTMPPGSLPGVPFKNIVEWKSRLWAVADSPSLVDIVYYSETNKVYAWPNTALAHPTGQDSQGIVAFAPRRNALGILKRNGLWQISGTSSTTGISTSNVSVSQVVINKAGCVAPDSVVIINDKAYWLANDGVWEWSDETVQNISNDTVAPWFKSDTYLNRSRFPNAFAKYNAVSNVYEIHVAALGSSVENLWLQFNLNNRKWYGPNKTALFTPSHASHMIDANGLPVVLVGGTDGVIYTANSANYRDGASTAIDMDLYTPFYHVDAPDIQHAWLELSLLSKIETGGTLSVTPYVGRLDASAGTAMSHDLTKGRERLRRLGAGPMMRLRMQQNAVNQNATIYGFEVPFFEYGRR